MAKADWVAIQHGAISDNSFIRKQSLSQSVTELEKALVASGVNCQKERSKRKSLADMFFDIVATGRDSERNMQNLPIQTHASKKLLRDAITARNKGVHSDEEVAQPDCERFVEIIYAAWQLLRDRFVTQSKASVLAQLFLDAALCDEPSNLYHFSNVYLFGSLTRSVEQANDIDLLLVDAIGNILITGYFGDPGGKEQSILRELDLYHPSRAPKYSTRQNVAAIECGWLNLSVITERFGQDRAWTREICALEHDPLFFLNVARDMLRYDPIHRTWTRDLSSIRVFEELAQLLDRLAEIGIVANPNDSHAAQDAEHEVTMFLSDAVITILDHLRKNLFEDRYLTRKTLLDWALKRGLVQLSEDKTGVLRRFL